MVVFTIEDCTAYRSPGRMIRRINKLMSSLAAARFVGHDLSFEQWIALKAVRDSVARNAGELARELDITTGATTRMIDGLEARGLVRRVRDGGDRRVVQLEVTPAGDRTIDALHDHVLDVWNEVMAEFGEAEVEALVASLAKLLHAAQRIAGGLDARVEAAE